MQLLIKGCVGLLLSQLKSDAQPALHAPFLEKVKEKLAHMA